MKNLLIITALLAFTSCQQEVTETKAPIDTQAELDKITQMRASFEQTVKAKRYDELGKFVTPDLISIGPGSEDWIAYRKLREIHGNKFRYDSIKMRPLETVILSDTMAYDFGISSVYYTDSAGTVHEMEDTFLVLLKKTKDGEWRLFRELASSLVKEQYTNR